MFVRTENAQTFDFGLKGHEVQKVFSLDKYRELVGESPRGKLLKGLIDEHWSEWLNKVEQAPWLRYWNRYRTELPKTVKVEAIAQVILSTAVWGFGYEEWLKMGNVAAEYKGLNKPTSTIIKLQQMKNPSTVRKYMYDDALYRGCGLQVPAEYGELDRWLEQLWQKVLTL